VQLGPNTFTFFDPRATQSENPIGSGRFGCGSDMPSIAGWCTGQAGLPIRSAVGLIRPSPSPPISARSPGRTASAAPTTTATTPVSDGRSALDSSTRSPTIGAKAEGLYVRIDRDNNNQATGSLPYAVASGLGFPAAGTSTLFYAPATAFSPRGNRNDDDFFVLRAGVNYRFGTM